MKKGTKVGNCVLCPHWGLVSQHHSKPATATQRREGPIWLVCSNCHTEMHRQIENSMLREMSVADVKNILSIKLPKTKP
jgi:predicted HNH restriction endonuclease